jgi:hypothetical protein
MTPFPVQELKVKDTVLVEMCIGRYRTSPIKQETGNKTETPEDILTASCWAWVTWQAHFVLKAVSLIHRDLSTSADTEAEQEELRI